MKKIFVLFFIFLMSISLVSSLGFQNRDRVGSNWITIIGPDGNLVLQNVGFYATTTATAQSSEISFQISPSIISVSGTDSIGFTVRAIDRDKFFLVYEKLFFSINSMENASLLSEYAGSNNLRNNDNSINRPLTTESLSNNQGVGENRLSELPNIDFEADFRGYKILNPSANINEVRTNSLTLTDFLGRYAFPGQYTIYIMVLKSVDSGGNYGDKWVMSIYEVPFTIRSTASQLTSVSEARASATFANSCNIDTLGDFPYACDPDPRYKNRLLKCINQSVVDRQYSWQVIGSERGGPLASLSVASVGCDQQNAQCVVMEFDRQNDRPLTLQGKIPKTLELYLRLNNKWGGGVWGTDTGWWGTPSMYYEWTAGTTFGQANTPILGLRACFVPPGCTRDETRCMEITGSSNTNLNGWWAKRCDENGFWQVYFNENERTGYADPLNLPGKCIAANCVSGRGCVAPPTTTLS